MNWTGGPHPFAGLRAGTNPLPEGGGISEDAVGGTNDAKAGRSGRDLPLSDDAGGRCAEEATGRGKAGGRDRPPAGFVDDSLGSGEARLRSKHRRVGTLGMDDYPEPGRWREEEAGRDPGRSQPSARGAVTTGVKG